MPFNNLNAYERRVESLSNPMLIKERNKYVQRLSEDVATCIVAAGTAPFTGPFAGVVTAHSAYLGVKHFGKHKTVRNEMARRGLEVRFRKRDVMTPVSRVAATEVAGLGLKSVFNKYV